MTWGAAWASTVLAVTAALVSAPDLSAQQPEPTATPETTPRETFERFAVAADVPAASEAGAEVLRHGGNAADAAAATMLALGVTNPASSGLGGGGFALYYKASDRSVTFLDFRERAPNAATPTMFQNAAPNASRVGGLAVAVPGEPAGIAELVRRFWSKPLSEVAAPAIRLATAGPPATSYFELWSHVVASDLPADPTMRRWLPRGGESVAVGTKLVNPLLVRTLRTFARSGAEPFYRGAIAREIVRRVRGAGGVMTAEDLASYQVVTREPLEGVRFGHRIVTAPPPSAGGYIVLASLAFLERRFPQGLARIERDVVLHTLAESWKGAFGDRAQYFGDPDFGDVPVATLLAPARIASRLGAYRHNRAAAPADYARPLAATPSAPAAPTTPTAPRAPGPGGTSHICVVDAEGNIASVTTTVNLILGARISAAGIVLNDEMDDFTSSVGSTDAFGLGGGAANRPGPGHRPVSSMAPTIVFSGDRPMACLGGSGGGRIPTAVTQVALALLAGASPHDAVEAPRIHHQGDPNRLEIDPQLSQYIEPLRRRGHAVSSPVQGGQVQAIVIRDGSPRLLAASDSRKGGRPAGE